MLSPKQKFRELRMEDQPDPTRPSSNYRRHLEFFNINPESRTIKAVVTELKIKVRESFIRKCHYLPQTYQFKDFRITRTYRLHKELLEYLAKLSSWLYRGNKIPASLKKAFSRSHTFVNPYEDFCSSQVSEEKLSLLNNLMLTVAFNQNICSGFPDQNLRTNILKEMKKRNLSISKIEKSENVLIEVIKTGNKEQVILLQKDRD